MSLIEFLKEEKFLMENQFKEVLKEHKRNAYANLSDSGVTVVYGLRGTGKTTLLAQKYFDAGEQVLAIHGEHLNLAGYRIKDLIPSMKHFLDGGHLFIDEITKLGNWPEELKVLSDLYPKTRIVVTGSSAVNLQEARRTLARRAVFINMKPLTLNEFLRITQNTTIAPFDPFSNDPVTGALKTELDARNKKLDADRIVSDYKYMNLPYLIEKPAATLLDVVERVIYEDIGGAASFDEQVLEKFLPLLKLLALSEKTSYDSLSRDLGVGKGTVIRMLEYLSRASIIRPVYPYAAGKSKVRKELKYLFTTPAIRSVILHLLGEKEREAGLSREDMFAMHIDELFYLKEGPDYVWKNAIFEIGGPGKGTEQFRHTEFSGRKLIVYDSLGVGRSGSVSKIPFYIFLSHF